MFKLFISVLGLVLLFLILFTSPLFKYNEEKYKNELKIVEDKKKLYSFYLKDVEGKYSKSIKKLTSMCLKEKYEKQKSLNLSHIHSCKNEALEVHGFPPIEDLRKYGTITN